MNPGPTHWGPAWAHPAGAAGAGAGAGRILKSRSRPFPTHPRMKYFRRETLAVDKHNYAWQACCMQNSSRALPNAAIHQIIRHPWRMQDGYTGKVRDEKMICSARGIMGFHCTDPRNSSRCMLHVRNVCASFVPSPVIS